ncbi:MAG: RsmD family RNA methyltransferase [Flavobacteriales bacterium]
MRIICGRHKGKRIRTPKNSGVRPTTDRAKEALFNILENRFVFGDISALDLFSGTGNISYELASRGAADITGVDNNRYCRNFIKKTAAELGFPICVRCEDALRFLEETNRGFDFIYADPPYTLCEADYSKIHRLAFDRKILKTDGLLVFEHARRQNFEGLKGFLERRKYGSVHLSFFSHGEQSQ